MKRLVRALVVVLLAACVGVMVGPPLVAIGKALAPLFAGAAAQSQASAAPLAAPFDLHETLARWRTLLANTALILAIALAACISVATALALPLARTKLLGRRAVLLLIALAACFPQHARLVFFGATIPIWELAGSRVLCGLFYAWLHLPVATLLLYLAFSATDRAREEAALLDASASRVALRVMLPEAAWALAAVAVLLTMLIATDANVAAALVVRTFAEEVYTQYVLNPLGAGPLLAGLPVLVTLAPLLFFVAWRLRVRGEHSVAHGGGAPRLLHFGGVRWPLAAIVAVACLLLFAAPLVTTARRIESFAAFAEIASTMQAAFRNALIICLPTAAGISLAALALASIAARAKLRVALLLAAISLALALPAPALGITLIETFNATLPLVLLDSAFPMIVAYFARYLPIAVLLLAPAIQQIPRACDEAARIDGADWFDRLRRVHLPACLAPLAFTTLIIALLCVGEIACTQLLVPPGWSIAAVIAYNQLHYGLYQDLAVLSLLSAAAAVLPWLLAVIVVACSTRIQTARPPIPPPHEERP